jgi:hypothetical protein
MNIEDLDKLLDQGEAFARLELIKRKSKTLTPFYHIVAPEQDPPDIVIPVGFESDAEKDLTVMCVTALARLAGATAVMFVAESWMISLKNEGNIDMDNAPRPSKHPDRVECVLLVVTDGVVTRQRLLRIARHKTSERIIALHRDPVESGMDLMSRMTDGIITPRVVN